MAHPTSGFYLKDEHEYVSVSTILGETSKLFDPGKEKGLQFWRRSEPDWEEILERAQRRGKIIHAEIEGSLLDTGTKGHVDEATYDEIIKYNIHEYLFYLAPILEHIKHDNSKNGTLLNNFYLEGVLYCPQGFAGTADARFFWEGKYSIWDWKTVRSYKEFDDQDKAKKPKPRSKYESAFLQLGAYALAHNIAVRAGEFDTMITQGVICVSYDWRPPQLHILDGDKLRKAVFGFIERFKAYCELMETEFPRPIKEAAKELLV